MLLLSFEHNMLYNKNKIIVDVGAFPTNKRKIRKAGTCNTKQAEQWSVPWTAIVIKSKMREVSVDIIHVPFQESQSYLRSQEVPVSNNTATTSSTATRSWGSSTPTLYSKPNLIYPIKPFSTILSACTPSSSITTRISSNSKWKSETCFVRPMYLPGLF